MALPASYTEATFAAYLHALLSAGGLATDLGWSLADGSYDEVINDALGYYGAEDITTISGATSILAMRIAGRVALWKAVSSATAHYTDASTPDGARANLSQLHTQALAQYNIALGEAGTVGLAGLYTMPPIMVGTIRYKDDPYRYHEADDEGS
jgi:hypothetical protein